jgi:WD40 repeat protein
LLEILKNSNNGKTSPKTAGKALTILSELNFDFTDQDLSSVQVSEAKINGGIFKNTLLSKSILKSSSFSKSLEIPQLSQDRLSEKSKIYKSFKGDSEVTSLVISPDQSKIIAGTESGSINIWELSSGLLLYSDLLHSQKVTCLDVSSDSVDLVSGSSDFSVKLFDLHQKKCILTLNSHLMPVTSVKISPDNEFIISAGSDNKIKISTKHGEPYSEYKSSSKVTCLSLPIMHDKDSESLLYGNTGGDVIFWKFGDKRPFWTAEKIHPGGVVSVILNKTAGKIITVGFDGIVKIWISFKGKKISRFFNPRSASVNIEASLGQNGFFAAQGVIGAKFCVGFDRELNVLVWNGRSAKVVGSHRVGFKTECFTSTQNLSHLAFVKGKNVRIFEVCRILKFSMD